MSDELDGLELRARLHAELDELAIFAGPVRDELVSEPELALRFIDRAKAARGIRNRAAFLISQWRRRRDEPAPAPVEPEPELAEGPPDLDTLEQAWSAEPSPAAEVLLRLLALAISRHGGFHQMRADFERRRSTSR